MFFFKTSLILFPLFQNETKTAKANWFEQNLNYTVLINNRYIWLWWKKPCEISGKCSIPFFSVPMFTQAGNIRTTTGTLECLTAIHPTIKTVGDGPVWLLTTIGGEGNLVWCWGRFEGANRAFFMGFASSVLATSMSWAWSRLNPCFLQTTVIFTFLPSMRLRDFWDAMSSFLSFSTLGRIFFYKHIASPRSKTVIHHLKSCKESLANPTASAQKPLFCCLFQEPKPGIRRLSLA